MTGDWVRVTQCDSIPHHEGRVVSLRGQTIAIFNVGHRFLAVENRCPHRGGPLADGIVSGEVVVCPLHAWKINLANGEVERPGDTASCVKTYPTRVEGGTLLIEIGRRVSAAPADICVELA